MSSACVCHTGEWCFYCEMYMPLESKYQLAQQEIEKWKNESEKAWNEVWSATTESSQLEYKLQSAVEALKKIRENSNDRYALLIAREILNPLGVIIE